MATLQAASNHYRAQQRLTAAGLRDARRSAEGLAVAAVVGRYQVAAATLATGAVPAALAAQQIPDQPVATVAPIAFMSGAEVAQMLASTATQHAFDRLVATLINDAGRQASAVSTIIRPNLTGYVRYLNLPSCARCAILAGRFYRWSTGFLRHPLCDCVMLPSTQEIGKSLVFDANQAFRDGQIRGLSKADTTALEHGANMSQVVNARSGMERTNLFGRNVKVTRAGTTKRGYFGSSRAAREAGYTKGGNKRYLRTQRQRLAVESIIQIADGDRDETIRLLKLYGYII